MIDQLQHTLWRKVYKNTVVADRLDHRRCYYLAAELRQLSFDVSKSARAPLAALVKPHLDLETDRIVRFIGNAAPPIGERLGQNTVLRTPRPQVSQHVENSPPRCEAVRHGLTLPVTIPKPEDLAQRTHVGHRHVEAATYGVLTPNCPALLLLYLVEIVGRFEIRIVL